MPSCSQGDSALMAAALKGHEATALILLQTGASIRHRNKNGDTAIRYLHYSQLVVTN